MQLDKDKSNKILSRLADTTNMLEMQLDQMRRNQREGLDAEAQERYTRAYSLKSSFWSTLRFDRCLIDRPVNISCHFLTF